MPLTLTFSGVLEATFLLFRRNFRTFFLIGLLSQIPLLVVEVVLYSLVPPSAMARPVTSFLVEGVPTFLTSVLYRAAIIRAAEGPYEGRAPSPRWAVRGALAVYGRLALAAALLLIGTAILVVGFAAPAVWFYFACVLVSPVVVLEHSGPIAALRRAAALSRGAWARIMGVVLITWIVTSAVQGLLSLAARAALPAATTAEGLLAGVPSAVIGCVAITLIGALSPIALTVLYHDRIAVRSASRADTVRDGSL